MPFFRDSPHSEKKEEIQAATLASSTTSTPPDAASHTCQPPTDPGRPRGSSQAHWKARGGVERDREAAGEMGSESTIERRASLPASVALAGGATSSELVPGGPLDIPAKPISPPPGKRKPKRIRFTGAIGEFLDSATVWSDFAVMETERKSSQEKESEIQSEEPPAVATGATGAASPPVQGNGDTDGRDGKKKGEAHTEEGNPRKTGAQGHVQSQGYVVAGEVWRSSECSSDEPESPRCRLSRGKSSA